MAKPYASPVVSTKTCRYSAYTDYLRICKGYECAIDYRRLLLQSEAEKTAAVDVEGDLLVVDDGPRV